MLELYWQDKIWNVFREGKGNNKIWYYENVLDDNQPTKQRWFLKTKMPYIFMFWGRQLMWQKCSNWFSCRLSHLNITSEFPIHGCHGNKSIFPQTQALPELGRRCKQKALDSELRAGLSFVLLSYGFHMCPHAPGSLGDPRHRGTCWSPGAGSRTNEDELCE